MAKDVNWSAYFKGIRRQCPWSWQSYRRGRVDIQPWSGRSQPLGDFDARVYLVTDLTEQELETVCERLDSRSKKYEWLFSYPGYGKYATPVAVLIQQDRRRLEQLREKLDASA